MSGAREIFKKAYSDFVFIDGGCGSILQAQGLQPGELPETWNILHPEIIQKMHRDYLLAGANILTSNTFGANINKFQPGDIKFSLDAVIGAAIKNAREAIRQVESDPSTPEAVRNQPHFALIRSRIIFDCF